MSIEDNKELFKQNAKIKAELSLVEDIVSFGGYKVTLTKSDRNGDEPIVFEVGLDSSNDETHREIARTIARTIKDILEQASHELY